VDVAVAADVVAGRTRGIGQAIKSGLNSQRRCAKVSIFRCYVCRLRLGVSGCVYVWINIVSLPSVALARGQSPTMEAYYKEQKIIAPEKWDAFLAAARTNLPTTFRISPVVAFADDMKKKLRSHFADLKIDELAKEMQEDDERLRAPEPIAWYPDELAWGMSISKKALKKTPALEKFHKYLVAETETGNITRQEAVSMIPPLFMDVEPHHRVLDMCAAPGSKTSQCLEFLHAKCGATGVPAGVVIANDADLERCSMLTHQMKRINSPSLVVLHHEAQNIPMLWQKSGEGESLTRTPMRYDRVLADVPCSGDGTMRKNVDVWRKWSPAQGLGLHKTQLMILARAVELCEVGGVVVYSTCSMNPIENESVVAAALGRFRHCLELEDTSSVCPSLIRHAGLHTWRVRDRKEPDTWYTPEDLPGNLKQIYPASVFPPTPEDAAGEPASIFFSNILQIVAMYFAAVRHNSFGLPSSACTLGGLFFLYVAHVYTPTGACKQTRTHLRVHACAYIRTPPKHTLTHVHIIQHCTWSGVCASTRTTRTQEGFSSANCARLRITWFLKSSTLQRKLHPQLTSKWMPHLPLPLRQMRK